MSGMYRHDMLPSYNHDEDSRQDFVRDFRTVVGTDIGPSTKKVYKAQVEPAYEKEHGRKPKDRHEVRSVMTKSPSYQFWSAMQRNSQEMLWDSVIDSVERELPDMIGRVKTVKGNAKGSLRTNPDFQAPRYHTAADIHLQPGGYHSEFTADDVAAGAVYDMGTYVYLLGLMGPKNDDLGQTTLGYFKKTYPNRKPQKILDMGCGTGTSTGAWAEAFPDAEVHACDLGAGMVRYGHGRAESLGLPIHFSQQNCEHTDYPDESFDLVLSHIMLHETSTKALPAIFRECHRLLKPGGLMIHLELPHDDAMEPYDSFLYEWEVYNNNETFYGHIRNMDLPGEAAKAGFDAATARTDLIKSDKYGDTGNYTGEGIVFGVTVGEKK